MKKIIVGFILIASISTYAQVIETTDNPKFQVGLQYNPILGKNSFLTENFKGIVGINARYNFISAGIVDFNVGLNVSLLTSDRDEFSDMYIWNPNVVAEFNVFDFGLKPYLGVGYDFGKTTFESTGFGGFDPADPAFMEEVDANFKGFNINPGLRYYFRKIVFIDASYNYLSFKNDDIGRENVNFINIGVGARF